MPDNELWLVPFHFWSVILFILGCIVGSFLNVCIYRMPRGESIVHPPSHCPRCGYHIPWHLNVPLFTWLWLRGRCAHCQAPITARYFVVELLTGLAFLSCWLGFGRYSIGLALCYCVLLGGLVVATFIDFEHFIIPDEITVGGIVVGFLLSFFVPALHHAANVPASLKQSALGIGVGAAALYIVLRLGKLAFGKQQFQLPPDSKVVFTETTLQLPDQEIPFDELFYRQSDTVVIDAKSVQMAERQWENVTVKLSPSLLRIGEEPFKPEDVPHLEVVTDRVVIPREAMGLGDVKFIAAIGAFLGWQAVLFCLMLSSVLGAVVGLVLIALQRRRWSSRLPYGPYIAAAAVVWMFGGRLWFALWLAQLTTP